MSSSSDKKPPKLENSATYADWKKMLAIWRNFTSLEKSKQGGAVVMSLTGTAQESVLEIDGAEINADDGIDKVIAKLDKLYMKDATLEKFETLEAFDSFQRKPETSIQEHIHEFEKIYNKLKDKGTTMSDDLLAYKLLKSVKLSEQDEKIVKGTTTNLTLEEMKTQLKKIFPDSGVKSNPVDTLLPNEINQVQSGIPSETFYNNSRGGSYRGYTGTLYQPRRPPNPPPAHLYRPNNRVFNPRGRAYVQPQRFRQPSPGRNPINPSTGRVTRCNFCSSLDHWVNECPNLHQNQRSGPSNHIYAEETFPSQHQDQPATSPSQPLQADYSQHHQLQQQQQPQQSYEATPSQAYFLDNETTNEAFYQVILFQKKEDSKKIKGLVAESFNCAVLDSAASKTVCGRKWFDIFKESLPKSHTITTGPCSEGYKFGDSKLIVATECAVIPATLGNKNICIATDIVEQDVPFLLSRGAMKKMQMIINFGTDSASFLGTTYPLTVTSSGHYTIPLTPSVQLLSSAKCNPDTHVVFTVTTTLNKHQQALKLHRQFAHAPADRIISLLNTAGKPWSSDTELKTELSSVTEKCQTCLEYAKELPRPSVALPSANSFQETVALDLKFYTSKILLHLIDHATRYSACAMIPSKRPEQVVKAMFSHWISIFGPPRKFLSDNGGEFINQEFIDLCEVYNITLKTTGAEAPWSNGLIERHNQVLGNMLDRVLNDVKCSFEVALMWCVNAKNSLQNVHGFSPYQLVFGHNPVLPSPLNNRPPALEDPHTRSTEIVKENLNAQHSARVAFMESERSERIRRALRTNTRSYSDQVILNRDKVYYKRQNSKKWKGPAFVLGRDGQQILLKHGGYYIRVHPCRVRLSRDVDNQNPGNEDHHTSDVTLTANPVIPIPEVTSDSDSVDSEDPRQTPPEPHQLPPETPQITTPQQPPSATPPTAQAMEPENVAPQSSQLFAPTPPKSSNAAQSSFRRRSVEQIKKKAAPNRSDARLDQLKKGDRLLVRLSNSADTVPCSLLNRAGKRSSKLYKNEWNVQYPNNNIAALNFDTDVDEWTFSEHSSSDTEFLTFQTTSMKTNHSENEIQQAKMNELQDWTTHNVYEEIPDTGQQRISVRWVVTPKVVDGIPTVKARLVAKGYQELQNFRKDSPTCSRESIRLALSVIASKKWKLQGIDIRRAFLQGSAIDRVVYLKPPPEANTDMLWLLRKCVYGLGDASRSFYLKLHNKLVELKMTQSNLDQGLYLFFDQNNLICGILVVHVDDLLHGGNDAFHENVIKPLSLFFTFGVENYRAFEYLGLELLQNSDWSITVNQNNFANTIKKVQLSEGRQGNDLLTKEEKEMFRSAVGQLTWLSGISRPEISFQVCFAASVSASATVNDAIQLNKTITRVQNSSSFITFPSMNLESTSIVVYTDGSFNSLPNGSSQGGQIVFLVDGEGRSCPLAWNSTKIRRVVRSALAAETLSFCDGCELAQYLMEMIRPICSTLQSPIQGFIDSQSLYETLGTSSQVSDRRLRVEISALRQMIDEGDVRVNWVSKHQQVADALTKNTASDQLLVKVLQDGTLQ